MPTSLNYFFEYRINFLQCKSNCCDSDQKMKGHLRQELNFWESNEATCRETVTGEGAKGAG